MLTTQRLGMLVLAAAAVLMLASAATAEAQETCSADTAAIFTAMETVADLGIPSGNALMIELASAMAALAAGDTDDLVSDLESFIGKVETQSGKQIDPAVAEELIALAQSVLNGALCPCAATWAEFLPAKSCSYGFFESVEVFAALECQLGGLGEFFFFGGDADVDTGCIYFDTANPSAFILVEDFDADAAAACVAVAAGYIPGFGCPQSSSGPCNP